MSDLYGNNYGMNNNMNSPEDEKKKKMIIIGGAATIGVLVIIIIVIVLISSMNDQKNNLYIDGKLTKLNSTLLHIDANNVPYLCIEKIAPKLAYEFYNGEYGTGSEDKSSCYVQNEYEIALLEFDSNLVYKTLRKDNSSTFDTYKMSYKVKRINDMLYISLPTMQKVFNVKYNYNQEKNNITINTLPALYQKYNSAVKNAGYHEMAKDFPNQKALVNDMIVVVSNNKQYGVIKTTDIKDPNKSTIIGAKYPNITYCEGMGEFIVKQNNKYGVLNIDEQRKANVKIGFEYDELKLIDNGLGLYLVKNMDRYGVLESTGRILINLEYDAIGIENSKLFVTDNLKNPYVLYNNCIPVKQGEKWGLFNVKGNMIFPISISGFGCIASTGDVSKNVLLIPETQGMEGIVFATKNFANKTRYGILNTEGTIRIPNSFDSIFKRIINGETEYVLSFQGSELDLKDKLKDVTAGSNSGAVEIQ